MSLGLSRGKKNAAGGRGVGRVTESVWKKLPSGSRSTL